MQVVDAEHHAPIGSQSKHVIFSVRIILLCVLSCCNPGVPCLLQPQQEILRYPVAQDEVAVLVEKAHLLLAQMVGSTLKMIAQRCLWGCYVVGVVDGHDNLLVDN